MKEVSVNEAHYRSIISQMMIWHVQEESKKFISVSEAS